MKRTVLAIGVAAVLAVAGIAAVVLYVSSSEARILANKQPVRVLVATSRIPAGTTGAKIREGNLAQLVTMPKESVPADALGSISADLDAMSLSSDVQKGQLLMRSAFAAQTTTSSLLRIPEGKIAVTVTITMSAGAMYLKPGSKVAVYDTYTVMEGSNNPAGDRLTFGHGIQQTTRLLLPSVDIIAIGVPNGVLYTNGSENAVNPFGTHTDSKSSDKSNTSGDVAVITFAVDQAEGERLIHGQQTGTLYVALVDDTSHLQLGAGVNNNTMFN